MAKNATYISVLLDRSGSMGTVKKDTIGGFNQFLNEQKKAGSNATLTLVQFDTQGIDTVYENSPLDLVPDLNDQTYQPRGGTPLLDALGQTIERTGSTLKAIPEADRPDKIVFVIITDGQENSSHKFNKAQVSEMVKHQSDVYKWVFVYLGANQDAFAEAGSLGIVMANATNYASHNTSKAFGTVSANLMSYRQSGAVADAAFTDDQRVKLEK